MLRQNIPSLAAVKNSSKINILSQAAHYIQYLEHLTQQAVQQHTFYDSFTISAHLLLQESLLIFI